MTNKNFLGCSLGVCGSFEDFWGGIFWNAAWVFWGFGGSFAGIFGACSINLAKFVQLLAI